MQYIVGADCFAPKIYCIEFEVRKKVKENRSVWRKKKNFYGCKQRKPNKVNLFCYFLFDYIRLIILSLFTPVSNYNVYNYSGDFEVL